MPSLVYTLPTVANCFRLLREKRLIAFVLVSFVTASGNALGQTPWAGGNISFSVETSGYFTFRWERDPVAELTGSPGPLSIKAYYDCDVDRRASAFEGSTTFRPNIESKDLVASLPPIRDDWASYAGENAENLNAYERLCFEIDTGGVSEPGSIELTKAEFFQDFPAVYLQGILGYQQNPFGAPKVLGSDEAGTLLFRGDPAITQRFRGYWVVAGDSPQAGYKHVAVVEDEGNNSCAAEFTPRFETQNNFNKWITDLSVYWYPYAGCDYQVKIFEVEDSVREDTLTAVLADLTPVAVSAINFGSDRLTLHSYGDCAVFQVTQPRLYDERGMKIQDEVYDHKWYRVPIDQHSSTSCDTSDQYLVSTSALGGSQTAWDRQVSGSYIVSGSSKLCDDSACDSEIYYSGIQGIGYKWYAYDWVTATPEIVDLVYHPGRIEVRGIAQTVSLSGPGGETDNLNGTTQRTVTYTQSGPGAVTLSIATANNVAGCTIDANGVITSTDAGSCTVVATKTATDWYAGATDELTLTFATAAEAGNNPDPVLPAKSVSYNSDTDGWSVQINWDEATSPADVAIASYNVILEGDDGSLATCTVDASTFTFDLQDGGDCDVTLGVNYEISVTATDANTQSSFPLPIALCLPPSGSTGNSCDVVPPQLNAIRDNYSGYIYADWIPLTDGEQLGGAARRYRLYLGHPTEARTYTFTNGDREVPAGGDNLTGPQSGISTPSGIDPYTVVTTDSNSEYYLDQWRSQVGLVSGEVYDFFIKVEVAGAVATSNVVAYTSETPVSPPTTLLQTGLSEADLYFHLDADNAYAVGTLTGSSAAWEAKFYEVQVATPDGDWYDVSVGNRGRHYQDLTFPAGARTCSSNTTPCYLFTVSLEQMVAAIPSVNEPAVGDAFRFRMRGYYSPDQDNTIFWSDWSDFAGQFVLQSPQVTDLRIAYDECRYPYSSDCAYSRGVDVYDDVFPEFVFPENRSINPKDPAFKKLLPLEVEFVRGVESAQAFEWSRDGETWWRLYEPDLNCTGNTAASICTYSKPRAEEPPFFGEPYDENKFLAGIGGEYSNVKIRALKYDNPNQYSPIAESGQIEMATLPSAPSGIAASVDACSIDISWTAPVYAGDSASLTYEVSYSDDFTVSTETEVTEIGTVTFEDVPIFNGVPNSDNTSMTSIALSGLAANTEYLIFVDAKNGIGLSPESARQYTEIVDEENLVVSFEGESFIRATTGASCGGNENPDPTPPSEPTNVIATGGDSEASVSWTVPASDGGDAITGYTVTAFPDGQQCTTTGATSCTVTGLTNGVTYTFTVTATNSTGEGADSSPSNPVTPMETDTGITVPGPPTGASAIAGSGSATISWVAPESNGGATITRYTVTASPGGQQCTTTGGTTCTVTGLSNDTSYTFTVTATNSAGTGAPSSPTSAVTPTETSGLIPAFDDTSSTADGFTVQVENYDANYTWTVTSSAGSASIDSNGVITVTGLAPGETATVTVTTTREGYEEGSATVEGGAAEPMLSNNLDDDTASGEAKYIFGDGSTEDTPLTVNDGTPPSITAGEGEFQMDLQGNEEGAARIDENSQTLVFYTGKEGLATGRGFLPGSEAEIWLFSTPRFLASTRVLTDGTFSQTFDVPPDIEVGEHVIQAEGLDTNSEPKAIAAGVIVAADEDGDLVADPDDACPGTSLGATVDAVGCSDEQRDDDGDGVANGDDQCANSPAGEPVNSVGCPQEAVPVPTLGGVLQVILAGLLLLVGILGRREVTR